ncbi:MAG: Beta-galactosidase C-terminal domain [Verrucomicrobiae bacterium]
MKILAGIQPHQVLQRDSHGCATLKVTGRTTERGPVLVAVRGLRGFAKPRPAGLARAGRFTVSLAGLPVGGPYEIELRCGEDQVTVSNVHVGDVWLLGGQSNMQGYGDLASGLRSAVGVFSRRMSGIWEPAEEPLHMLEESPDPAHTAEAISADEAADRRLNARTGAGPALTFAAEMLRRTAADGREFWFFLNFRREAQTVLLHDSAGFDLLAGNPCSGELSLSPYGAAVLSLNPT